mmetsp:Transcript_23209/g.58057  ORF Transcript_23209/g.58057 Transcript_23209/m.58057 type:complete len:584 (+) Transcript_23209:1801-3552(+)
MSGGAERPLGQQPEDGAGVRRAAQLGAVQTDGAPLVEQQLVLEPGVGQTGVLVQQFLDVVDALAVTHGNVEALAEVGEWHLVGLAHGRLDAVPVHAEAGKVVADAAVHEGAHVDAAQLLQHRFHAAHVVDARILHLLVEQLAQSPQVLAGQVLEVVHLHDLAVAHHKVAHAVVQLDELEDVRVHVARRLVALGALGRLLRAMAKVVVDLVLRERERGEDHLKLGTEQSRKIAQHVEKVGQRLAAVGAAVVVLHGAGGDGGVERSGDGLALSLQLQPLVLALVTAEHVLVVGVDRLGDVAVQLDQEALAEHALHHQDRLRIQELLRDEEETEQHPRVVVRGERGLELKRLLSRVRELVRVDGEAEQRVLAQHLQVEHLVERGLERDQGGADLGREVGELGLNALERVLELDHVQRDAVVVGLVLVVLDLVTETEHAQQCLAVGDASHQDVHADVHHHQVEKEAGHERIERHQQLVHLLAHLAEHIDGRLPPLQLILEHQVVRLQLFQKVARVRTNRLGTLDAVQARVVLRKLAYHRFHHTSVGFFGEEDRTCIIGHLRLDVIHTRQTVIASLEKDHHLLGQRCL